MLVEAIIQGYAAGATMRELMLEHGLSYDGVRKIVAQAAQLAHVLYQDATIYLARKHERFISLINRVDRRKSKIA